MVDTVDYIREADVEDNLRDAAVVDIPAVVAPMDNPEADSEIGILESIKNQRIKN